MFRFATASLVAVLIYSVSAFGAAAAPPGNDDFDNTTIVPAVPFGDAIDTSEATTAPDDPNCVGQGPTVWYGFTAAENMKIEANTFGSSYDTTLSAYTGSRGSLTQIACNDDSGSLQSRVIFDAVAGTTYYLMVGAFASGPGGPLVFSMAVLEPPVNDDFDSAIAVGSLPFADTRDTANATTAADDPSCGPREATVWYRFASVANQRIQLITWGSNYVASISVFTGARGNLTPVVCGQYPAARFDAVAGETYYVMIGSWGAGGLLALSVQLAPPPLAIDVEITGGSVDPTTGVATVTGTISCTQTVFVFGSGAISQKIGNGLVTGSIWISVHCTAGAPSTWSAVVSSQPVEKIGRGRAATLFTAGPADAWIWALAFEPFFSDIAQDTDVARIVLRGGR